MRQNKDRDEDCAEINICASGTPTELGTAGARSNGDSQAAWLDLSLRTGNWNTIAHHQHLQNSKPWRYLAKADPEQTRGFIHSATVKEQGMSWGYW